MEHTKHIIRAVLLLVAAAMAFVLVRHFLIPETFGAYGHFRYTSVAELTSQPSIHGDVDACVECHDEQAEVRAEGKHRSVSCEVCHAPLGSYAQHSDASEQRPQMPVNRSVKLCGRCHQRLVARPEGFPQVVLDDHVIEKGGEMTDEACLDCHDAHNPSE